MVENKDLPHHDGQITEKITPKGFFTDMGFGFMMGVAFIIPGFSGGSVAAILGIYDRLISAIAGIFTSFKRSFMTILPIFLGLVIGAVSLLYPLGWALEAFPIQTVSLFVGLALGGTPNIYKKADRRLALAPILAFLIPTLVALVLTFIPPMSDVNMLALNLGGYLTLILFGIVASSALVIPGISGSMILLILGCYNPIINVITDHFLKGEDMLVSFLVLMSVGIGIIIGFIGISVIMKRLMDNFYALTYTAILGFIVGSIPTVFISTAKDADLTFATLPMSAIFWISSIILLAVGVAVSLFVTKLAKRQGEAE